MSPFFALFLFLFPAASSTFIIEVDAGSFNRTQSPIIFECPKDLRSFEYFSLKNLETNKRVAIQKYDTTSLFFILDEALPSGKKRKYQLKGRNKKGRQRVKARLTSDALELRIANKPILRYWLNEQLPIGVPDHYKRSGFVHPLYSPKGAILTDDFPEGHTHQHGLFFAWVNTTFRDTKIDFWNQHDKTGTVKHIKLDGRVEGQIMAGFTATLSHQSLQFGEILQEKLDLKAYSNGPYFIVDITSVHKNTSADTLYINKYHYGGLGIRGNRAWNKVDTQHYKANLKFLTNAGHDRVAANHTKPDWIKMYGPTAEGNPGLLALAHPSNIHAPQSVRVHPEMPYFCFAPMVDAAFSIAPNQEVQSSYRIILYDHPEGDIEEKAFWRDYNAPPNVKIQ